MRSLWRGMTRRLRSEAGASSVELLVFFPLLLLIVLLTVQVAGEHLEYAQHLEHDLSFP